MAGSYSHCTESDGRFQFDLIENMGDAYGACEHMHFMIRHLAEGDTERIRQAEMAFYGRTADPLPTKLPLSAAAWDRMLKVLDHDERLEDFFYMKEE